jgi:hypothetical protein
MKQETTYSAPMLVIVAGKLCVKRVRILKK